MVKFSGDMKGTTILTFTNVKNVDHNNGTIFDNKLIKTKTYNNTDTLLVKNIITKKERIIDMFNIDFSDLIVEGKELFKILSIYKN